MFDSREPNGEIDLLSFSKGAKFKDVKNFSGIIHIRLHQRNGRKSLTTIQGLCTVFDFDRITKALKKEFCCNGCVVEGCELGTIIQLQGDQRENVKKFFLYERIVNKKMIKIHGI
mmetsp:Transcript_55914/g.114273  ORF Transcript_55914/g.114273 Transcript_55914/m.114273 type:complete len:115 (-) Transcript_55914:1363-1707(-)